ncbi:MAG: carbohydrate ABC transporter permease [Clostridia bacterium]|nr:carbohydrate ABC transporter permease [Clostridia bacterium]MBQ3663848.1 carbohydrate ABC transporter permease [Clostridia bacterium]
MMYNKRSAGEVIALYVIMVLVALFFLLPFVWILRCSMVSKAQAYMIPPDWSAHLTLENYRNVMSQNHFGKYFLNSLLVGLVSTMLSLLFGALASYWIVRISHRPDPVKITILCTQMIPPVVLVIPLAIMINRLKMGDTFPALIISYLTFNLPYVIWQLISFFQSIPRDLDEAAAVDGCTRLQAYFRIVLPLARPGLIASGVYCFIVSWNEFMFANNFAGLKTRTIPVAIAALETQDGLQVAELCASCIIAILPVVLLSIFIKKYLVNGLTFGAVK